MSDFAAIKSSYIQAAYAKASEAKPSLPSEEAGTDFSQLLAKAASGAADTVREGDKTALAALNGQAGLQQVVEATIAMESTVQVSVALRDKLVEAYQDIMRMPI